MMDRLAPGPGSGPGLDLQGIMAASPYSVRLVMTANSASSAPCLASAAASLFAAALLATGLLATTLLPLPAFAQGGAASAPATPSSVTPSSAPSVKAATGEPVTVDNAWVRATVSKQRSTGAFFSLASSRPMRLVAVESPAAEIVEIHEMALVDNIMRMRAVDVVPIVPGQRVELQPSGLHVMLIDLVQPIQVGDVVPLTLVFEDDQGRRTTQAVSATVRPLTATGSPNNHHGEPGAGHGGHGGHGTQGQGRH